MTVGIFESIHIDLKSIFRTIFDDKIEDEDTRRIRRETQNGIKPFEFNGAGGGNRTHGLGIMRPSLYH
jgi:hypothetical protein